MKKIITAIGNSILNEKLKESGKYDILGNDIQYKEGVLEFLSEKSNIDILIISEILYGSINFKELIKEILKINSKIEIIVFIENENKELINFLFERGIYKIFQNNQIDINDLEKVLESESTKSREELNEEIRRLKQIIELQKQGQIETKNVAKITAITGSFGSRKERFNLYNLQRV